MTSVAALYVLERERFEVVMLDDALPGSGGVPIYTALFDMPENERPLLLVWTEMSQVESESTPGLIYRQRSVDSSEPQQAVEHVTQGLTAINRPIPTPVDSQRRAAQPPRRRGRRRILPLWIVLGLLLLTAGLVVAALSNRDKDPALGPTVTATVTQLATDAGATPTAASSLISSPTPLEQTPTATVVVGLPASPGATAVATELATAAATDVAGPEGAGTSVASATAVPALLVQQIERMQAARGSRSPVLVNTTVEALVPYMQTEEEGSLNIDSATYNPANGTVSVTGRARFRDAFVPGQALLRPVIQGGALQLNLVSLTCALCGANPSPRILEGVRQSLDLKELNDQVIFNRVSVVPGGMALTASAR